MAGTRAGWKQGLEQDPWCVDFHLISHLCHQGQVGNTEQGKKFAHGAAPGTPPHTHRQALVALVSWPSRLPRTALGETENQRHK